MKPEQKGFLIMDMYLALIMNHAGFPSDTESQTAKKCALIMTNEMIRLLPSVNGRPPNYQDVNEYCSEYWEEVKYYLTKKVKG